MKYPILILFFFTFISLVRAQDYFDNSPFNQDPGNPNLDFSMSNFTNWESSWIYREHPEVVYEGPAGVSSPVIVNIYGNNNDGNAGPGNLPRVPGGLQRVARHGDPAGSGLGHSRAYKMKYNIHVSADYPVLFFQLAVLMDNTHGLDGNTHYKFAVKDASGNILPSQPCTGIEMFPINNTTATAGSYPPLNPPYELNINPSGNYHYMTWESVAMDLSAYAGQTISIEFEHFDCSYGVHGSYTYMSAAMRKKLTTIYYCEDDTSVEINPYIPRFENYQWNTGATTESITVNNPVDGAEYSVDVGSYNQCSTSFHYRLKKVVTTADFNFGEANICETVQFTDQSAVNDGNIVSWEWNFGDPGSGDNSSTLQHPSHHFTTAGIYNVSLTVTDSHGCIDTITIPVEVHGETMPAFNIFPQYCLNSPEIPLPEMSLNGIGGTWNHPVIETGTVGITTYIFTPYGGQCAQPFIMDIEITENVVPVFTFPLEYCTDINSPGIPLPSESANLISGSWNVSFIDITQPGITAYTFTPDVSESCAVPVTVYVEVFSLPVLTAQTHYEICFGEDLGLSVQTDNENTVKWYDAQNATVPVFTGNPFVLENLTVSVTYWAEAISPKNCASERMEITITVNPLPEVQAVPTDSICEGETAELNLITNGEIINWYDSEDGTTPIFTGNPFTTPILTETTSYWAEAVNEEGCVSERIEVIVEVTESIVPEFELQTQYCQNTEPQELPTTSDNGITGSWFPGAIDTSTVGTQTYIFTPDEGQCATGSEMTVEVVETPELTLPETPEICFGETITLNLSTTGETVNWYEDEFSTIPFHTGITYTTPPLTESATYWIEAVNGECISERLALVITVNELPGMEAENPDPICVGSSVELSVLTNGEIINWYDSETATTPIFTGNPFTTPVLTETTSYWAEAVSEAGCISERIEVIAEVTDSIIPIFDLQYQYCLDADPQELPTTSDNGITGSWFPATIDTSTVGTQTYTFTPDEGQCAEVYPITIETAESLIPVFSDLPEIYCFNSEAEALPGVSDNGISGSWYPGEINTGIQGITGYVFTPDGNQCSEPYELVVTVYPYPEMELEDDIVICSGDSYSYLAPEGFDYYIWTDSFGNVLSETREIIFTEEGIYTLTVEINGIPCTLSRNIEVSFSTTPIITEIKSTESTLTVYATGNGPFEYSLDEIFWQSSSVFYNLEPGIYFVYVRDGKGCGSSARQGAIMGVPNFISPNGDGKNDTWKIRALAGFPNTRLQIFDRYGKMFVDRILDGDFEWDGRYNREPLPSGTYWYILMLEDGEKLSGHINLRNY